MKSKSFAMYIAMIAMLFLGGGCQPEVDSGDPTLSLDPSVLEFEQAADSKALELTANREWKAEWSEDWLTVGPERGAAASASQTVTVAVTENTGTDRTATVKFTIGTITKNLTVTQAGPGGSAEDLVIYYNDFDKTEAKKDNNQWKTFLDSFDGWKNETGSGLASLDYAFDGMSARTASGNSASNYSDYKGSGLNYLWFGSGTPYFIVKNLTLDASNRNYKLSFGAERNEYNATDNTFQHEEFKVYASSDGEKWVELEYAFPNGDPNRRWDLASSTFTLPEGTTSLSLYFTSSKASAYLFDDLKLEVISEEGTPLDFTNGVELPGAGGTVDPGDMTIVGIADILALGEGATIGEKTGIEAVIISNAELNNLTSKRAAYVQDATGGLQLRLSANHEFKFGDKVRINLSGQKLGSYNKAVQVEVPLANASLVESGQTVEAKTVSMDDFLANKYEGQYVAIENVQVAEADLSKTFVVGGSHTSISIEDKDGNTFLVFSSSYSTFGSQTVPQGSGTLKGIAARNNDNIQLIFAQESDYAGLTGERFDGTVTPEPEVIEATVAEFLAASVSTSQYYRLTGTITEIVNTSYGNFYLADETGSVYVYGLTKTKVAANDKSFSELGLEEGYKLVLEGTRAEYSGTAQVGGPAYYISHETSSDLLLFGVSEEEMTVTASSESATFDVTGNVDWTAEVTEGSDWVTILYGESGTGNDSVVLQLTKNETGSARTAKITVSTTADVATKSYEVVLTQAAMPTGDEIVDILDNAFTGVSGTTYTDWTGTGDSGAEYSGQSAGQYESIQLRSNNSNSGIVTTVSGGKVRKVVVKWNSNTSATGNRALVVYGSSNAFTSPTELYNVKSDSGIKELGSIVCGTSTELEIAEDVEYIGLRSKSGAMYIDEIQISWE